MYEACSNITDTYYVERDIADNSVDWKEELE